MNKYSSSTMTGRISKDYNALLEQLNIRENLPSSLDILENFHKRLFYLKELILLQKDVVGENTNKYYIEFFSDMMEFILFVFKGRQKASKMMLRSSMEMFMKATYYKVLNSDPKDTFSNNIDECRKKVAADLTQGNRRDFKKLNNVLTLGFSEKLKQDFYWNICDYVHTKSPDLLSGDQYLLDILESSFDMEFSLESIKQASELVAFLTFFVLLSNKTFFINEVDSNKTWFILSSLNEWQTDLIHRSSYLDL